MKKKPFYSYLFLLAFFLLLFSFSAHSVEKWREKVVCSIGPCWHGLDKIKKKSMFFLSIFNPGKGGDVAKLQLKKKRLKEENQLLRSQLDSVRAWLVNETRLREEWDRLRKLQDSEEDGWKSVLTQRAHHLSQELELGLRGMPARVIFRDPTAWSSSIWIDRGEKDNQALGKQIIAEWSPVLSGNSLIGVVEFVGKKRSRVRLITDSRLHLAVRAVRGSKQNRLLLESLETVLFGLTHRQFGEKTAGWVGQLDQLKEHLLQETQDLYLAKGEIHGTSQSLWRCRLPLLKGVGFNYDFSDEEGEAKDLRTGISYSPIPSPPLPLLKIGDLLVTSGLDGIFPPGLKVAVITSMETLKEGATTYSLQALATAKDFNGLDHLFVLPSRYSEN